MFRSYIIFFIINIFIQSLSFLPIEKGALTEGHQLSEMTSSGDKIPNFTSNGAGYIIASLKDNGKPPPSRRQPSPPLYLRPGVRGPSLGTK